MMQKSNNKLAERQDELPGHVHVTLILNGDINRFLWNKQTSLLGALLKAGADAPYSCCSGTCGTCVCKLEEGEIRLKRNFILSETHLQQGLILTCVAVPLSDSIRINYDEL